jgi:hypothetical protein
MKNFFCLIVAIILFSQTNAQTKLLQLSAGTNFNGSGDSFGFSFFTEYSKKFKKKLTWAASVGGTINDGSNFLLYEDPQGLQNDGSLRYTIGGFQAATHVGYSFIGTKIHDFQVRLGSVIRYQSSSFSRAGIDYPPNTGLPYPVYYIMNDGPQRTLALGGSGQLVYNFTLKNNICLGVLAGLQFDTQGDTISQLMFTIGKRF